MDEGSQRPQYRSEAGRYVEGGGEMLVGKSPKHQFSENAAKSLPKISAETQETFLIRADLLLQCVHDTERSGRIEASLFTFHSLKKAASGSQIMRVCQSYAEMGTRSSELHRESYSIHFDLSPSREIIH